MCYEKKLTDPALQTLPVSLVFYLHEVLASHHHHNVDLQKKMCYYCTKKISNHL